MNIFEKGEFYLCKKYDYFKVVLKVLDTMEELDLSRCSGVGIYNIYFYKIFNGSNKKTRVKHGFKVKKLEDFKFPKYYKLKDSGIDGVFITKVDKSVYYKYIRIFNKIN